MSIRIASRGRAIAACVACVGVGAAMGPTLATGAGGIKDVFVTNTAADPVPTEAVGTTEISGTVEVANQPAVGEPWQVRDLLVLGVGDHLGSKLLYTVPEGKRLRVDFISANTPPTDAVSAVIVSIGDASVYLPMHRYNDASAGRGAEDVTAYANAGETVRFFVRDNSGASVRTSNVTVVGELFDA